MPITDLTSPFEQWLSLIDFILGGGGGYRGGRGGGRGGGGYGGTCKCIATYLNDTNFVPNFIVLTVDMLRSFRL